MESTTEKICSNCGEKLSGDSSFCVRCGAKVEGEMGNAGQTVKDLKSSGKNRRKISTGVVAVVVVALVWFGVNAVQISNLKKELMRDWERVEGDEDAHILCILDFSEDEIEYKLETGYSWMDMTASTYKYKVISGNKMKVNIYGDKWETVTVEFDEDKTMMTVSPALTSVDDKEYWFNIN
ncbi:MAG: zinc ribbon domain-containing protein [Lachnospiraceae bacterium]|nr:zinc ribbon domain-containing protein [Lachnospiraceae bacterium]